MWLGSGLGSILHKQTGGLPLMVHSYITTSTSLTKHKSERFSQITMSLMNCLYLHIRLYTVHNHLGKQIQLSDTQYMSFHTISLSSLTCFKSYFPVFAVEVCVDKVPEDVRPIRQREGVEKLRHSQGGQLAKLWLQHRPQTETQTQN